mgnify:FL=1
MKEIVKVENLIKKYKETTAVNNISFTVNKGEVLVIIGSSGSGKSTVLRCMNQLEEINGGNIKIDNDEMIKGYKKEKPVYNNKDILKQMNLKCGFVFQNFNLFPHKTILENVTEAMKIVLKMDGSTSEEKAIKLLDKMGIKDKKDEYPCNLSGGQKQRASIARALAIEPEILFMDEPTSALDPELTGEVLKVIKKLADEKTTMVIVTHEIQFAQQVADRIIFMDKGTIIETGTPNDIIKNPKEKRTREFLKRYLERV